MRHAKLLNHKWVALAMLSVWLTSDGFASNPTTNLITFDDLGSTGQNGIQITNGYGYSDFKWSNFYALDGIDYNLKPNGFKPGVISANNIAYNGGGTPATITLPSPMATPPASLEITRNSAR